MTEMNIDELNIAGQPMAIDELHYRKKKGGGDDYDFGIDEYLNDDPAEIDSVDELRVVRKVLTIEEFFEPMRLTEGQRGRRIELARKLEDDFLYMLYWLDTYDKAGRTLPADRLAEEYRRRVMKSVGEKYLSDYRKDIINGNAIDFAKTTIRRKDDDWFTSPERATALSENLASDIFNDVDFEAAVSNGRKSKKWYTIMDGKERSSHADVDGKKIPINDLFTVGGSLMRYPRDMMYGAGLAEIANCRCSLIYS